LCKGADSHVLVRSPGTPAAQRAALEKQLAVFAVQGLRTLVFAKRTLTEAEFLAWHIKYMQASNSLGDREAALAAVAEELEQGMYAIGATVRACVRACMRVCVAAQEMDRGRVVDFATPPRA
jgi:phospholipid-translocating ATPase